jgi:hypothetical protein
MIAQWAYQNRRSNKVGQVILPLPSTLLTKQRKLRSAYSIAPTLFFARLAFG